MAQNVCDKIVVDRRNGERADRVIAISHRLLKRAGRKVFSDWSLSTTKNMSHSGLLFLSSVPYRKNDILELQVVMSGVIEIFNGQAQVARVEEKGSCSFDIGVKYIQPKMPTRRAKSHLA